MATQTAIHGVDIRQGASTPASSYAPMPGSPTLTNPDMILPDYDYSDDPRSQSPLASWNPRPDDLHFQLPPPNSFIAGPITPATPIIYGNGTMLSDIGEVTEVESVAGVPPPRRVSSHLSDHSEDAAMRSSPTMGASRFQRRSQILKGRERERRSSMDSTSTVTTQDQNAAFADFDDAVSVDDSNFQGDDEESMASEYVEGTPAQEPASGKWAGKQSLNEDRYSTNSLSERAEEILANAKRRLTTMEGNLSRARSSLHYSSVSDGSTPSPPIVRPATSLLRESTLPSPTSPGHSRMLSENGLNGGPILSGFPQRSASALGAAGGYRQPLTASRSADALGGSYAAGYKFSHHPLDTTLEPLGEDDGQSNDDSRPDGYPQPNLRSPTFGSFAEKELTRSASVAQMRDLKDQMKDLKGKISTLKEQARADSMKRRSLQSLRTPSPFTHARWDHGFMEPRRIQDTEHETTANQFQAPWNYDMPAQAPEADAEEDSPSYEPRYELKASPDSEGFRDGPGNHLPNEMTNGVAENEVNGIDPDERPVYDEEDLRTENGDEEEDMQEEDRFENAQMAIDAESTSEHALDETEEDQDRDEDDVDDYVSESGDSLYHDTFQHPVSHEDREDAFDYEHFFLHSAMGTISQQRLGRRGSTDSVSSDDSIETARGPLAVRARRPSIDTMSSVNSFATATEGRASRASRNSMLPDGAGIKHTVVTTSSSESDGPPTAKRQTFGGFGSSEQWRPSSHRSTSSTSVVSGGMHRPSISSFESTGTNRSFPLVNKAKLSNGNGVLTPNTSTPGASPDSELKQVSRSLMDETNQVCDSGIEHGSRETPPMQMLPKDDQILVERLVASLGKCVLSLSEASRASSEARAFRRRIDTARKILEGLEDC